jgi:hypothetical protein|tara:strand:+ start:81 stop:311 length:231 start_codon:yes stop_codon:yes gene_type:complete
MKYNQTSTTRTVRNRGGPSRPAPKATPFEVIKDQGKVPFNDFKVVPTPKNLAKGTVTTGTSRGMGAMLRGGGFTIC